ELAAACYTFGIPHPTGYPLFLVSGYLFSHLPLPGSVIYKLNLISAIRSALAVIITFYVSVMVTEFVIRGLSKAKIKQKTKESKTRESKTDTSAKTGNDGTNNSKTNIYLIAFFTAKITGLAKTFWFDATEVEVYALHSLFISIIFYLSIKIIINITNPVKKYWALLFLFFGLSAANHSTTIYFIPGIIYLFYQQYKANRVFAKAVLIYILLIIPGLLFYLILMVRASS